MARDEEAEEGAGLTCSICDSPMNLQEEGGIQGNFGICPVAFCIWCYASIVDMVQMSCARCYDAEMDEMDEHRNAPATDVIN
jgi:hypothetical protein|tara:strand:+ start:4987 stop:5232 length:246 start_codon:yes stop_codon:yes gene_type:complete